MASLSREVRVLYLARSLSLRFLKLSGFFLLCLCHTSSSLSFITMPLPIFLVLQWFESPSTSALSIHVQNSVRSLLVELACKIHLRKSFWPCVVFKKFCPYAYAATCIARVKLENKPLYRMYIPDVYTIFKCMIQSSARNSILGIYGWLGQADTN